MVEVVGKKARLINAHDPAHRRAYNWEDVQCKERKERSGGKERKKETSSPRIRTHNPHLVTQDSSLYSNNYTAQRSLASIAL